MLGYASVSAFHTFSGRNCNAFTNEACLRLVGSPIPPYINRMAYLGSCISCFLPRHLTGHAPIEAPPSSFRDGKNRDQDDRASIFGGTHLASWVCIISYLLGLHHHLVISRRRHVASTSWSLVKRRAGRCRSATATTSRGSHQATPCLVIDFDLFHGHLFLHEDAYMRAVVS